MRIGYTAEHEWVTVQEDLATVGITDRAQSALGDLVFIELPKVGTSLKRGGVAGVLESVKAASDIFSPLTGTVVAVNEDLATDPTRVNLDSMGAGWLFKLRSSDLAELNDLLTREAYEALQV